MVYGRNSEVAFSYQCCIIIQGVPFSVDVIELLKLYKTSQSSRGLYFKENKYQEIRLLILQLVTR